MSRVAALSAAARSATAKFHQLRLKYWDKSIDVICCVEGNEDLEYYLPEVRRKIGKARVIDGFVCAGKYNALQCLDKITRHRFSLSRLFFMVDSDLDQFLGIPRVVSPVLYYTDHYSVESNCVSPSFFQAIWIDIFHLSVADPRYLEWSRRYMDGFVWLSRLLKTLTSMAIECKRLGGKVEFDRLELVAYFKVDGAGKVSRKRRAVRRKSSPTPVLQPTQPIDRRAARIIRAGLNDENFMFWLRGKFALLFAIEFFKAMTQTLGAKDSSPRAVVRYRFSVENGVDCIATRSAYPVSFLEFLDRRFAIIESQGTRPGTI